MGASTTSRSDQAGYRIGLHAGGRPRPSSRGGDTLPADALIIRTPIAEDREPARVLCRSMHARTIFADIAFSDAKFNRGADRVLSGEAPHTIALVAELNSRLVGAAWATAGEYFIGEGEVLATVHFIAVDTDFCGRLLSAKVFLRLVAGIRAWAKTRGASRLLIHVTTGEELAATDRLLKAAGMNLIGGAYVG
jgi:hypothetical protein